MIAEGGQADQGAAQQSHHLPAEQPHQKRPFQHEIEEAVAAENAQHHADGQRRHQKEQQLYFLIGVAIFGEQQTLRNERKRTSSAASAAAQPTFSTSVNINSRPPESGSISLAGREVQPGLR